MSQEQNKIGYIYILSNTKNNIVYVGVTANIVKRVHEHKQKLVEGFTKKHKLDKLVYFESYDDIRLAIAREKVLKKLDMDSKLNLVKKENPKFEDLI
ncbi:GIY-YIG nuclease family protein [Francisella adeliensis]|uniref:GIY-YIG nuclease n=1 Tax=Francisella adeliensis TaxID=2007306 RepID=A0A2Z4Y0Y8_9GAMM|nr:GIY-YIG nuclease family protein [Francisella adeliensis]AXA34760.1 GIY-YIG nuclease [Francisella adeliensis]MBK2084961.1 GIY-YIG nuclease family protein [Francisella adeliensis]MBK2096208.1 GIY-YIG nuclease family protein [Francisella adeliensis]QIW12562.1 GIY-YIG nuclease family protein [Francisella adeliensis]QIW14435.1 GIY-YIG nuclease family protein [Francisella adeliensis]